MLRWQKHPAYPGVTHHLLCTAQHCLKQSPQCSKISTFKSQYQHILLLTSGALSIWLRDGVDSIILSLNSLIIFSLYGHSFTHRSVPHSSFPIPVILQGAVRISFLKTKFDQVIVLLKGLLWFSSLTAQNPNDFTLENQALLCLVPTLLWVSVNLNPLQLSQTDLDLCDSRPCSKVPTSGAFLILQWRISHFLCCNQLFFLPISILPSYWWIT